MQSDDATARADETAAGKNTNSKTAAESDIVRVRGVNQDFSRRRIMWILMLPMAATLIAVSSVNVTLSFIGHSLQATDSDLQWVLSGYALAVGVFLVPMGRIGDLFGRGSTFMVGLAIFTLGSLACALAWDPHSLNTMRLVQGVGSGIIGPQITGMIQQYYTGQARGKAFGLMGGVIAASVAFGPVLSGTVITLVGETNGWRVSFLVTIPFSLFALILGFYWLPFGKERRYIAYRQALSAGEDVSSPLPGKLDLDPVGMVVLAVSVLSIMLPFTLPAEGSWKWWLLFAGLAGVALWTTWEHFYKRSGRIPMVDLSLFRIPSFSFSVAVSGLMFLGSTSLFVVVMLYLQNGLGQSAMATGLIGLPNAFISGISSLLVGRYALRFGRPIVLSGLAAMILGVLASIAIVYLTAHSGLSFWWLLASLGLIGYGQGAVGSCNMTLAMDDVPTKAGGTAGGAKQTVERTATAIGNAVVTAVFFTIVANLGAGEGKGNVVGSVEAFSWAHAFSLAYITILGCLLASMLFALFDWIRAARLRRRLPALTVPKPK